MLRICLVEPDWFKKRRRRKKKDVFYNSVLILNFSFSGLESIYLHLSLFTFLIMLKKNSYITDLHIFCPATLSSSLCYVGNVLMDLFHIKKYCLWLFQILFQLSLKKNCFNVESYLFCLINLTWICPCCFFADVVILIMVYFVLDVFFFEGVAVLEM